MNMRVMDLDGLSDKNGRAATTKLEFRLIDAIGKIWYLNMVDLTKRTDNPGMAWSGTEKQAHNVRAKYPHTRDLPLVRKSYGKQNPH